ncbi:hypothetical protein C2S51_025406 [Perilla frutescens var. frutescens]|nr:hypothetical protein C2S51_025406 [Perilla frutescens var. frutescens]
MASSVIGRFFQKRAVAGIFISPTFCRFCGRRSTSYARFSNSRCGDYRMISTISSRKVPSLILPPPFEGDDMVYKFYGLAENKVWSSSKSSRGEESESPDNDAEMVGSSHGWIVLFNRRNNDLFLSNPLSRRHIKLPPIDILPDPEINLRNGHGSVSKVILSASPDDERCHAVMTFGPGNRLAFCLPGRSWRWTPIGDLFLLRGTFIPQRYSPHHKSVGKFARVYEDMVYCRGRKVLTCMTVCEINLVSFSNHHPDSEMENWDIESPLMEDWNMGKLDLEEDWEIGYPSMELWNIRERVCNDDTFRPSKKEREGGDKTRAWVAENIALLQQQCVQIPHLVYAEQSDQLFLVMRFVVLMGADGMPLDQVPHNQIMGLSGYYRCKTVGFIVLQVDEDGACKVVDGLNGLAMFVGINHSFAISASELGFIPNSIYFTDAKRITMMYGSRDTGVFDYENKIITNIVVPGDDPIVSSPMWFNPLC